MKLIQSFAAFLSHIQVLYFWMLATLQCAINCPILAFSLCENVQYSTNG